MDDPRSLRCGYGRGVSGYVRTEKIERGRGVRFGIVGSKYSGRDEGEEEYEGARRGGRGIDAMGSGGWEAYSNFLLFLE